jgi:GMP synthase-like glutamine amidotransferase
MRIVSLDGSRSPERMSNCLIIQHVAPEGPWSIADVLIRSGVDIEIRRTFAGDEIPLDVDGYDGLVVMGGPMSANSNDGFPTREAELSLIADALECGIPTLGVCLGAQMIALAAGAAVYAGAYGQEIGWSPVTLLRTCQDDRLFAGLPKKLKVLHWHGDTFDLPEGAQLLMSSPLYPCQAFRIGEAAWGVQFHLEVTLEAVDAFAAEFAADAAGAAGGAEAIRGDAAAALEAIKSPRSLVFGRFARLVAARERHEGLPVRRSKDLVQLSN